MMLHMSLKGAERGIVLGQAMSPVRSYWDVMNCAAGQR